MSGKYVQLETDVYSVFASTKWKSENIPTYPSNFVASGTLNEFLRVSVIPSGEGVNLKSASGILIIDIFTAAGLGTRRASEIADKLDAYLVGSLISNSQFFSSSLKHGSVDTANPALFRSSYTISFKYSRSN